MFLAVGCSPSPSNKKSPVAVNGVLDLREWNFDKDGTVKLDGEWEFYWNKFIPAFPSDNIPSREKIYIRVPSVWNNLNITDITLPRFGYATYRIKILLKNQDIIYSLKTREIFSAYKLWVDGNPLIINGKTGTGNRASIARYSSYVSSFKPRDDHIDIMIHVSNFHYNLAGLRDSIEFGAENQIIKNRIISYVVNYALFGCALIMALFHFGLFIIRRNDSSTLFFGFFCLIISSRILFMEEVFISTLFPDMDFDWHMRVIVLGYQLAVPAVALYLKRLFEWDFSTAVLRIILAVSLLFSLYVAVVPARVFSRTEVIFQGFILLVAVYIIYVIVRAIIFKRDGSRLVLVGIIFLTITAVHDIMQSQLILQSPLFQSSLQFGFFGFIFTQSFLLSKRFSNAFRMAAIDDLSQVFNRRRFMELAQKEFSISNQNTGVISIDADHFKSINDIYGHEAGDIALKTIAETIQREIRGRDIFGRVGGEEFTLLIPGAEEVSLLITAERLRTIIEKTPIQLEKQSITVTVSMGVALGNKNSVDSLQRLLKNADLALYEAKRKGRNQVFLWNNDITSYA